ncbi:MAG: hypothetical protein AAGN66_22895 [Acidobacteriota bacterium]
MVEAAGLREKLSARVTRVAPHYRRYEGLVRGVREILPTSRGVLARMHRGEVILLVFSASLTAFAVAVLIAGAITWIAFWGLAFYGLERWALVAAFFNLMIYAVALFLVVRISLLRADHLRKLPWSRFVVLQAAGLILRWFADIGFVIGAAGLVTSLLFMPFPGSAEVLAGSGISVVGTLKMSSLPMAALALLGTFAIQIYCYALAAAIDTFLAIEQNTRGSGATPTRDHGELAGAGRPLEPSL